MSWNEKETFSFLEEFLNHVRTAKVTDCAGEDMPLVRGIENVVQLITGLPKTEGTLIFIGNGGSAAIASHQATDFLKTCGIRAYAPLDHSLLTCFANDCGYENVFVEPLKILAKKTDVLVAISSSGQSTNILHAARMVKEKGCRVITLSGFKEENPLRKLGDVNFHIPSHSYRIVESAHLFICNWLLEFSIRVKQQKEI